MSRYARLLRPLLFLLPPEPAHNLARRALARRQPWSALYGGGSTSDSRLATRLGELSLANPIGLSAGLDKNAEMLPGLGQFGFGYIVVGGVLPRPHRGNPRPRVRRIRQSESLINCYGLPSAGAARVAENLARAAPFPQPVVANIDADATEDYVRSLRVLEGLVDAVEVHTGCPNNDADSGEFRSLDPFRRLMDAVTAASSVPVFVKLTASRDPRRREQSLRLAECGLDYGVRAFTLPGTWDEPDPRLSLGRGHVSGRITLPDTIEVVRDLYRVVGARAAVKASGGISSADDAFRVIEAGATTVEILTSVIYRGPGVVRDINLGLLRLMSRAQIGSVTELVGRGAA